ncbi:glycoside hydrolase family 63 protein [Xylariaceae sp. AK1471]|nr:glycoside hydrolase family 63 protein [Xylariaceae sp. AK1471]
MMYHKLQVFLHFLLYIGFRPGVISQNATGSQLVFTWGPYRPNLYFGLRPRIPKTLLVGLMWANGDDIDNMLQTLRDTCEQDDGMSGYGWTMYDTRQGGIQTIHDSSLHIDMDTEFFKTQEGDSWGVRISGTTREDAPASLRTALIFHVALEQDKSSTEKALKCENATSDGSSAVRCHGHDPALGPFEFHIQGNTSNRVLEGMSTMSLSVPEDKIWQAKPVFLGAAKSATSKREGDAMLLHNPGPGNMHFIQVVFEGPFSIQVSYHQNDGIILDSDLLNYHLDIFRSEFPMHAAYTFRGTEPFSGDKYLDFTKSSVSNLLGGLGFFHGDSRVDYSHALEYEEVELNFWTKSAAAMERAEITTTQETSLLSHVPSRPFFPRGFLWDEGFHLLPVIEWDLDLAVLVLQSWFGLMDGDGWIGREQILGPEPRSKVPKEFQVQYPHFANPPTLILLLQLIISKITNPSQYRGHTSSLLSSPQEAQTTLKELYTLASRHYFWFRRTQAGNFSAYPRPEGANDEGYRWKGRAPTHTLTSGLDDYPRAEPPHPGELHVDALAWVGAAAEALKHTAEYLGEDSELYSNQLDAVRHNLDVLHWDPDEAAYCDATIDEEGNFARVCHIGYVSLLPFILGHLHENHTRLPAVLDMMSDPKTLLSPYGLRSLSMTDTHYGKDEDYWRGAVWVNLNVLAVMRLRSFGQSSVGMRAQALATVLRERIVNTVFDSWTKTGFFWEQYDDKTGEGKRSRAFTGWTACIVLLMDFGDPGSGDELTSVSYEWIIMPAVSLALLILVLRFFRQAVFRQLAMFWPWMLNRFRILKRWVSAEEKHVYEEVIDLDERSHHH